MLCQPTESRGWSGCCGLHAWGKDRAECPVDNLRELTWDSNPNCGIARERERETENFPAKNSNPRGSLAHSQIKGLSKHQRRASQLWTSPSPARGRGAGRQQPELEGEGQSWPQDSIFHQTATRPPVANQVFLGSWVVDICQKDHSQRLVPQRRHTAHLRWHSCGTARRPSVRDQGGDWDTQPT